MLVRTDAGRGREELPHQPRVLRPGRNLYPGGHIDNVRCKRPHSARDVVGLESPGKHYRRASPVAGKVDSKIGPRQRFSRSAKASLASRVENDRVGNGKEHLRFGRDVRARNSDRCPDIPTEFLSDPPDVIGCWIGVKLNDVQSRIFGESRDFPGHVGTENPDPLYARAGRVQDRASLRWGHPSRTVGEDDTYVADSNFRRKRGILWAGHSAELNFCEHLLSA